MFRFKWQVEVYLQRTEISRVLFFVKFHARTLNQSHHLLVKLSCESACENLNARRARSAVCLLQPILELSKESPWPTLWLRFVLFTHLLMYANTRLIEAE